MCLGIPVKITKIDGLKAQIEVGGTQRSANLQFISDAKVGDYVLVHAGYAIQKLDEEEAKKTLKLLEEIL
jgi:hydrogenase expression/formation protein HypC